MDSLLKNILSQYDKKKTQAEVDAQSRKEELYHKYPKLQNIDDQVSSLAISTTKSLIANNDKNLLKELNNNINRLKEEKYSILKKLNIPQDYFEPHYECPICKDTGYVTNNDYSVTMCSCLKQKLYNEQYNKSNISNLDTQNFDNFSDLLNFNYKFRDIKQKGKRLNSYDKIHLQTDSFDDISNLNNFIEEFTGSPVEAMKLDIDMDRFLTYSYVCIDSQNWDAQNDFEKISYQFVKFTKFLPADNSVEYEEKEPISFTKWKYAKFGISKQGVVLFTSDASMNNYTVLPNDFETVYLYTYILNLYKKLYLKKLEYDFQNISKAKNARKKFVDFTKNLWIQEITEDEVGSVLNYNISKILQINKVYQKIKNQYDILYKEYHVESNTKMLMVFSVILIVLLIFNILNYFAMF